MVLAVTLAAGGIAGCRGTGAATGTDAAAGAGGAPASASADAPAGVGGTPTGATPTSDPSASTTTTLPPGAVRTATGAGGAPRDERIGPPANGRPATIDLPEGTCFNDVLVEADGAIAHDLRVVDCTLAHDAEVFAVLTLDAPPGAPPPGDRDLGRFASSSCLARFEPFVGRDYATSELRIAVLRPQQSSWVNGDRRIVCSVYHQDLVPLVDSMAHSGR